MAAIVKSCKLVWSVSGVECVCCRELQAVRLDLYNDSESELSCITCREGFPPVWLNVWVVQAAHF